MTTHWKPGRQVVLRSVLGLGRIGAVMPVTIVADRDDLVALYLAPGTVCRRRAGRRGGPRGRQMVEDSGLHEDWVWQESRRLVLCRPDASHAVSLFWRHADDTFLCWYVDILLPFRRTPLGFDTRDLILDVVIDPDRTWHLKDEDELAWAEEQGLISPEEATRIRDEARHAVSLLEAGDLIYSEEWISWHPDCAWPTPTIPGGWNRLSP